MQSVRIWDAFDRWSPAPMAIGGDDGLVRVTGRFATSGERAAFLRFGEFSPWGWWLDVSAPGYRTSRIPLPKALGVAVTLGRNDPRTISLAKGKTDETTFCKVSETFFRSRGIGGVTFWFDPDGRFAWSVGGCRSQDNESEYGLATRNGDLIELAPIACPGREIHPLMRRKFRRIEWGKRAYLLKDNARDIEDLCRASLNPEEPLLIDSVAYARDGDVQEPPTGLPRLSARVWARFFCASSSPAQLVAARWLVRIIAKATTVCPRRTDGATVHFDCVETLSVVKSADSRVETGSGAERRTWPCDCRACKSRSVCFSPSSGSSRSNCAVFRSLYQTAAEVHGGFPLNWGWFTLSSDPSEPPEIGSRSFAVGFLPLLNIALIGGLLYLMRWVRLLAHAPAAARILNPRRQGPLSLSSSSIF